MGKAIAYFSNGIGNFILMMPALQAVALMTEQKKIDVCLSDTWKDPRKKVIEEICREWRIVGQVFSWPSIPFDPREYDRWFYSAHGSNADVVCTFLQNMKHRPVAKPAWRSSLIHEVDHYMEIAYAMGYEGPIPKVEFPLAEGPRLNGVKRPVIAFCNGAFKTREWDKKHWPHFKSLATTIKEYFGACLVGVGGGGELNGVLLDHDFTGKLSFTETARVVDQCDLLVTTDTALMHLADLMDLSQIVLFGPTLVSKNAPRNRKSVILMSGLSCAPCQDGPQFLHCSNYLCMEKIAVGDVMAVAKEKIFLKGG